MIYIEIANTIYFIVYMMLLALCFNIIKKYHDKLKWKYFGYMVLCLILLCNKTFYTFNEAQENKKISYKMSLQSDNIRNDNIMENYLSKQEKQQISQEEKLAIELEKQKKQTEKTVKQSFE